MDGTPMPLGGGMTAADVGIIMLIIVPIILAIVIVGFIAFIKWSKHDRERRL